MTIVVPFDKINFTYPGITTVELLITDQFVITYPRSFNCSTNTKEGFGSNTTFWPVGLHWLLQAKKAIPTQINKIANVKVKDFAVAWLIIL